MSKILDELISLLTLEKIEQGIYRGQSQDLGFHALFGGQVIGQALAAAQDTVMPDRTVHSLHSYFLRPGDAQKAVVYDVEQVRDGRSISTRRVKAIQNGKAIFYMTASFQVLQPGFEHQASMPQVCGPENLRSIVEMARQQQHLIPEPLREKFTCERPIEMRPVEPYNPLEPEPMAPLRHIWVRAKGTMPDDANINRYLLAYASDFMFLPVAGQPHAVSHLLPDIQMATIDHSMWFHRPVKMDQWLLYVVDSPVAIDGRGLVRGQYFDQHGRLVASTMQEGVIRRRRKPVT